MTDSIKEVSAGLKRIEEMKRSYMERIHKDGRAELMGIALEAMEKDNVEKVQWEQYTPYFNDGDPCTFSVGDVRAYETADGDDEIEEYTYDNKDGTWTKMDTGRKIPNIIAFAGVITELEDMMGIVFGDHVQVTILRDGTVEVEDYDHN